MHPLLDTPERIVEADGTVHCGWFKEPFALANLDEAPASHPLAGLRGGALGAVERRARRLRLKHWEYISVALPEVFVGAAVVNTGYLGTSFVYLVDRRTGTLREWSTLTPLGRGAEVARSSVGGTSRFERGRFGRVCIRHDPTTSVRSLEVSLPKRKSKPGLELCAALREAGTQPLVAVQPYGPGRWGTTHKAAGLPGEATVRSGEIAAEGLALGSVDWSLGYRRTRTWWNWAAGCGRLADGRVLGFQVTSHDAPTRPGGARADGLAVAGAHPAEECALWIDGALTDLGAARFTYDPEAILEPWHIEDPAGRLRLDFTPQGERSEDIRVGPIESCFHQPFGAFTGTVRPGGGPPLEIATAYGVTEQHLARW